MFFRSERFANELHFYAALLSDPNAVTPTEQYHSDESLAWTGVALEQPAR